MKRVYSSLNGLLVDNLYNVLEQEGIECEVRNRHGGSMVGEIPVSEAFTELWVGDADADRATERIEKALAVEEAADGEAWRCEQCGRAIEAQFDVCWHCAGAGEDSDRPTDRHPTYDWTASLVDSSFGAVLARYKWILLAALALLAWWLLGESGAA